MKVGGWICLILGLLSFLGAALKGNSIIGPVFWIGLGVFLLHRAAQKKKDQKDEENWKNGSKE